VKGIKPSDKICVLRGSSNESYLRALAIDALDSVTKPSQCLKMLNADRIQLFYSSKIGMNGLLEQQGLSPTRYQAVLNLEKENLYLAFSSDVDDARIQRWQAALEAVKQDGTLPKIYRGVYSGAIIQEICLPGDTLSR
jgi:polar amino acid transport system substrate-binding protein